MLLAYYYKTTIRQVMYFLLHEVRVGSRDGRCEITAFRDTTPCYLVELDRRFTGA
jgi:hypothetical protein